MATPGTSEHAQVIFTLELTSFDKAKDIWDMSEDEKARLD